MHRFGLLLALFWLGIAPAIAQSAFWQQTSGPGGGFVHDLAVAPDGTLFAVVGSAIWVDNGLYRSTDDGATWTALTPPDDEILTVTVAPDGAVFAARERDGVFRSRDDGDTWDVLAFPGDLVRAFAFAGGRVFAATLDGVYRSDDEGTTWTRVGLADRQVQVLATTDAGALLAATSNAVYRSTDDGATWTALATRGIQAALAPLPGGDVLVGVVGIGGLDGSAPGVYRLRDGADPVLLGLADFSVSAVGVDAAGRLYAGTSGFCTGFVCLPPGGLYRSDDDGASWTPVGLHSTGIGVLLVDQAGRLLAGTQGLFTDTGPLLSRGLFRSADHGATWTPLHTGIPHANTYALVTGPDGVLYAAADHSVYRSADRGQTWTPLYTDEPTLDAPWAPYYRIAAHPDGTLFVLAGHPPTLDGGIWRIPFMDARLLRSTDDGATWTALDPGLNEPVGVATLLVSPAGTLLLGTGGGRLVRSTDGGTSWRPAGVGLPAYPILALAPGAHGRLFAVLRNPQALATILLVYVSDDDGMTWTAAGAHARGGFASETVLPAADPDGGLYLAGHLTDLVHFTERDGTWGSATTTLPADAPVVAFTADTNGALYAATWDRVLRSDDRGATWDDIGGAIHLYAFTREIRALAVDRDGFLYAGVSTAGVFRSVDPVRTGVAGTPDVPDAFVLGTNYPNPFNPRTTIPFTLAHPARVTLAVYDLLGRTVDILVRDESRGAGQHTATWDAAERPSGVYVYKLITDDVVQTGRMVLLK